MLGRCEFDASTYGAEFFTIEQFVKPLLDLQQLPSVICQTHAFGPSLVLMLLAYVVRIT